VGYSTAQVASKETIHPSKRRKLSAVSAVEPASTSYDFTSSDSVTESDSEYSTNEEEQESRLYLRQPRNTVKVKLQPTW